MYDIEDMKLIIGLGNIGLKYIHTRHNLGFLILDSYIKEKNLNQKWIKSSKFSSLLYDLDSDIVLAKPQALMNNSGKTVQKLINFYKVKLSNVLIIHDDLDLNLSDFKLQLGRSSAGHKGVESVIDSLGSQEFWRLRVGIGRPPENVEAEEYVLQEFGKLEKLAIRDLLPKIFNEIENWKNAKIKSQNAK